MRKLLVLLVAVGLIACVAGTTSAQVVLISGNVNNGNMDSTYAQEIVPGFFLPKPSVWINEGTRALTGPYEDELSSEPWAGPAPTPVTAGASGLPSPDGCGENNFDCGVFFKAFSGNLQNGPATGHLYQDHPAIPGWSYTLAGWAGAEPNFLAAGAEIALEFLDGGGNVIPLSGQVIDLLPTLFIDNGAPFDYKQYTAMAVAPAGAANVRARVSMIGGTPNPLGGGQAFVVDDFTLTAIPEPTSVLLGLLGVCGVLGLIRRR